MWRCVLRALALPLLLLLVATVPASSQGVAGSSSASLASTPILAGLTLVDSQQTALAGVRARFAAQARILLDSLRDAVASAQTDTPTEHALARAAACRAELASLLDAERRAMRALLTRAQQSVYDANVAADAAQAAGGAL